MRVEYVKNLIYRIKHPQRHSALLIWLLLGALLIPIGIIVPEFFRSRNLAIVLIQMVPLGIIAIGQTYVILGGGIDLSVGAQVSLITIVASTFMKDSPASIIGTVILCLALGVFFGLLNGSILKIFPMPPIIATLCTGYLFQGISFALHKTTGGYIPVAFSRFMTASWGFASVPFGMLLLICIFSLIILYKMRLGRYIYALGGNPDVLENVGKKAANIRIKSFMIAGFLYAVAGLYISARLRSGSSHYGSEYTLLSITATVVGGTSLAGGIGGLSGTFAGTILISMLNNVLNNIAFRYNLQSSYYRSIIIGLILLMAMLFYRRRE